MKPRESPVEAKEKLLRGPFFVIGSEHEDALRAKVQGCETRNTYEELLGTVVSLGNMATRKEGVAVRFGRPFHFKVEELSARLDGRSDKRTRQIIDDLETIGFLEVAQAGPKGLLARIKPTTEFDKANALKEGFDPNVPLREAFKTAQRVKSRPEGRLVQPTAPKARKEEKAEEGPPKEAEPVPTKRADLEKRPSCETPPKPETPALPAQQTTPEQERPSCETSPPKEEQEQRRARLEDRRRYAEHCLKAKVEREGKPLANPGGYLHTVLNKATDEEIFAFLAAEQAELEKARKRAIAAEQEAERQRVAFPKARELAEPERTEIYAAAEASLPHQVRSLRDTNSHRAEILERHADQILWERRKRALVSGTLSALVAIVLAALFMISALSPAAERHPAAASIPAASGRDFRADRVLLIDRICGRMMMAKVDEDTHRDPKSVCSHPPSRDHDGARAAVSSGPQAGDGEDGRPAPRGRPRTEQRPCPEPSRSLSS